jgi:hypothetical protein
MIGLRLKLRVNSESHGDVIYSYVLEITTYHPVDRSPVRQNKVNRFVLNSSAASVERQHYQYSTCTTFFIHQLLVDFGSSVVLRKHYYSTSSKYSFPQSELVSPNTHA